MHMLILFHSTRRVDPAVLPSTQSSRTVTNIERMFGELARQYPTLDPANFITELTSTLEGLTSNTFDLTSE